MHERVVKRIIPALRSRSFHRSLWLPQYFLQA